MKRGNRERRGRNGRWMEARFSAEENRKAQVFVQNLRFSGVPGQKRGFSLRICGFREFPAKSASFRSESAVIGSFRPKAQVFVQNLRFSGVPGQKRRFLFRICGFRGGAEEGLFYGDGAVVVQDDGIPFVHGNESFARVHGQHREAHAEVRREDFVAAQALNLVVVGAGICVLFH